MPTNQTTKLMSKPEIKALPEAVQKRLRTFMNSIPKTKWYQTDGKPNSEWRVFYGDTWASARDSAWDFSLMARMIIISDLDYPDKEKHEKHVKSRIEVWKKGYGLPAVWSGLGCLRYC